MGKTVMSVSGLHWTPDEQTLTQNGLKTYMEDPKPWNYYKKQQKCFRTMEWAHAFVFVQLSQNTNNKTKDRQTRFHPIKMCLHFQILSTVTLWESAVETGCALDRCSVAADADTGIHGREAGCTQASGEKQVPGQPDGWDRCQRSGEQSWAQFPSSRTNDISFPLFSFAPFKLQVPGEIDSAKVPQMQHLSLGPIETVPNRVGTEVTKRWRL